MLGPVLQTVKNFLVFRHLVVHMIKTDIRGRFAGSSMGLFWNFIHPFIMLLVFLFVFAYIFRLRIPEHAGSTGAAVYIMAGLFPWMALAEGLNRSTTSLIENATLIQKTVFPTEILIAKAVITPFSTHGIAIALLALYMLATAHNTAALLMIPFVVGLQVVFTIGVGFIFASLAVLLRDTVQILQLVINFWLYITPILYPLSMLPSWSQGLMSANPVYPFVTIYQSLYLRGSIGDGTLLVLALGWSLLSYAVGSIVFSRLKGEFSDWL